VIYLKKQTSLDLNIHSWKKQAAAFRKKPKQFMEPTLYYLMFKK